MGSCKNGTCVRGDIGDQCGNSKDCKNGNKCSGGVCLVPEFGNCTTANDCIGNACVDGACSSGDIESSCSANSDCVHGLVCSDNVCKRNAPCAVKANCSEGYDCVDGICLLPEGTSCQDSAQCSTSICTEGQCNSGNVLSECSQDEDCGHPAICHNELCKMPIFGRCNASDECVTNVSLSWRRCCRTWSDAIK